MPAIALTTETVANRDLMNVTYSQNTGFHYNADEKKLYSVWIALGWPIPDLFNNVSIQRIPSVNPYFTQTILHKVKFSTETLLVFDHAIFFLCTTILNDKSL